MIAILKESDIDFIAKSYMCNANTNYVLRIVKVISYENERYCLFSLDYMNDKNRSYSLVTYKNKKCTCSYCSHSTTDALIFLLGDSLVTICFNCLQYKNFNFNPDVNIAFIAKLLIKYNHKSLLDKVFSNWDSEYVYYGYRIRNVIKGTEVFYYLDVHDRYSLHSINKNTPFNVTFNNSRLLYLYNYYLLMQLLKHVSDESICYKVLSKNFSQDELQDAMINLAKGTKQELQPSVNESSQYLKPVLEKTEDIDSKQSTKITSIKSKPRNGLEVGKTYKNAKVKLLHASKDNRGFYKGNYKFLYVIYYGPHALLWNTNKIVEEGNYICTFTVQRNALSKGYVFVNHCRLKKIEKEN